MSKRFFYYKNTFQRITLNEIIFFFNKNFEKTLGIVAALVFPFVDTTEENESERHNFYRYLKINTTRKRQFDTRLQELKIYEVL